MSTVSKSSRVSTTSSKNDVDVNTGNVIETLTVAITNDFYVTSYLAAEKVQNNFSFVDNYKTVVSNKINIVRSSIDTVRMFLSTALDIFNKNVTNKLDHISYLKILCEYLMPGEELDIKQQYKLFSLCLISVMDATNEFLHKNMSIIVSNTKDQKILKANMQTLKKKVKQLIGEFKIVKLNSEKATQAGRGEEGGDQRDIAIMELLRDKSMLKMELEERDEKILKLEEQKKALLNRIRELGEMSMAAARPVAAPITGASHPIFGSNPIPSAPTNRELRNGGGGLAKYVEQAPAVTPSYQLQYNRAENPLNARPAAPGTAPLFGSAGVTRPQQISNQTLNYGDPYAISAPQPKDAVGISDLLEMTTPGDDQYSMIGGGDDDENATLQIEL
jgi:hypothetical protein